MQIHNQRESDNSKNKDINKEKSYLNIDLHNLSSINYSRKVKEIIKEGYKGDRAIRKDAVLMTSTLITSDREFFSKLKRDEQIQFFKDSYDYLKDIYGKKNIVSATIHFDETTPHMHLLTVPLTDDGKLSAKIIFTRKSLRDLQERLPAFLQKKGFVIKRGIENSDARHRNTEEYKRSLLVESDKLENKMKNIKKEIKDSTSKLKQTRDILETSLDSTRFNLEAIDDIKSIKTKETFLGANKSIKSVDYDRIVNQFNQLALKNYDLARELKEVGCRNSDLDRQKMDLEGMISNLNFKVDGFLSRETDLRKVIEMDLKKEITNKIEKLESSVKKLSSEKNLMEESFDSRLIEETGCLKKENLNFKIENNRFKDELKVFYRELNIKTEEQKVEFIKKSMSKFRRRNLER